jgi:hypothetical protein
MMPAKMAQATVYDVLVAIDKIAAGKPQKCAMRNEIADYLGVDPDEISAEREPTLLLGEALERSFIERALQIARMLASFDPGPGSHRAVAGPTGARRTTYAVNHRKGEDLGQESRSTAALPSAPRRRSAYLV